MSVRSGGFVLASVLALVGCDNGTGTSSTGDVDCSTDPRAMTYAANMSVDGKSKLYHVELVSSDPAPPARGNDTWVFKVVDANNQPVSGATVTVTPYMPDHRHGTQVVPTVTTNQDGTFTATPLYFFMPGLWTVTFDVKATQGEDSVLYGFCVEG